MKGTRTYPSEVRDETINVSISGGASSRAIICPSFLSLFSSLSFPCLQQLFITIRISWEEEGIIAKKLEKEEEKKQWEGEVEQMMQQEMDVYF